MQEKQTLQLLKLNKILKTLVLFSKRYKNASASLNGNGVIVKWHVLRKDSWNFAFETIEFPISDLDIRVKHYGEKLNYAFKHRKNKEC